MRDIDERVGQLPADRQRLVRLLADHVGANPGRRERPGDQETVMALATGTEVAAARGT